MSCNKLNDIDRLEIELRASFRKGMDEDVSCEETVRKIYR